MGDVRFTPREWILLAAWWVIALARIFGVTDVAFQAVAHLFTGGLYVAWFLTPNDHPWGDRAVYRGMALLLTGVEIACFLASRA